MTQILKLINLQNELWTILTSNNNGKSDDIRIEKSMQLIADFINSEPSFETKISSEIPNECSSCEFWHEHTREGHCSQKVKLHNGKLDTQITFEDYGCNTWEKRK